MTSSSSSSKLPTKRPSSPRCQECDIGDIKYQCPRCSFQSCSLTCCVAHKKRTKCNGKRILATEKNAFLPLAHMTDETLHQDYHFLEHVLQTVESNQRKRPPSLVVQQHSKRSRNNFKSATAAVEAAGNADSQQVSTDSATAKEETGLTCHPLLVQQPQNKSLPGVVVQPPPQLQLGGRHTKFRNLARLAAFPDRRVHVLFMSPGMQRPLQNKSYVKKQCIHWTVECIVHGQRPASPVVNANASKSVEAGSSDNPASKNTVTLFTVISEQACIWDQLSRTILERQAELRKANSRNIILHQFVPTNNNNNNKEEEETPCCSHQLLLELPRAGKRFVQVPALHTLRETLQDSALLEFPTFHWVPPSRLEEFPQRVAPIEAAATSTTSTSTNANESKQD